MSKLTRTLILGAALAAMNLAGMTAVAQAQAINEGKDARRPPTERQVGESYRNYHEALAAQAQTARDDAVERFRRGERASQEQTAADAALQRQLARERPSIPSGTPAPAPAEPNGQSGWLLASFGVLVAAMALIAGLAVLAAKRAGRRARVGHAA